MGFSFSSPLYESSFDLSKCLFQGTVVNTEDPEQKNRVKVQVDTMTNEISEDDLPWYVVLASAGGGNNAVSSVPSVGSRVLVQFPDNDIYNAIITYSLPQKVAT